MYSWNSPVDSRPRTYTPPPTDRDWSPGICTHTCQTCPDWRWRTSKCTSLALPLRSSHRSTRTSAIDPTSKEHTARQAKPNAACSRHKLQWFADPNYGDTEDSFYLISKTGDTPPKTSYRHGWCSKCAASRSRTHANPSRRSLSFL